jgi:dsRNA-specific ribonuclease
MKRSNRFDNTAFEEKIAGLLVNLAVEYSDISKYPIAFFHRSSLNELDLEESNERVEFL